MRGFSHGLIGCLFFGAGLGMVLDVLTMPLPWLIGPLCVTAASSLIVGAVHAPPQMRWTGQFVIATAVAGNVTPDILNVIQLDIIWMVLSAAAITVSAIVCARLLGASGKIDRATAIFSLLPGGAVEMATLATRFGGDGAFVALAQTLRVSSIVIIVPLLLLALETPLQQVTHAAGELSLPALAAMIVAGAIPAIIMFRLNLANAYFIGPLFGVAAYALSGLPTNEVPPLVLIAAQIMLGVSLGAMFDRSAFVRLGKTAPFAVAISAALLVLGLAIGIALSMWGIGGVGAMLLANAPGSVAEMAIVAKAYGLEPGLVAAYHLVRIFIVVPFAPVIYRMA